MNWRFYQPNWVGPDFSVRSSARTTLVSMYFYMG